MTALIRAWLGALITVSREGSAQPTIGMYNCINVPNHKVPELNIIAVVQVKLPAANSRPVLDLILQTAKRLVGNRVKTKAQLVSSLQQ